MPLYCQQKHENQAGSRFCLHCGEPLWLPSGYILEHRYRLISQLSAGGFGRAYLAEDLHRFNERCVLKEFAPQVQGEQELQKAKELFQREAGALYKLNHPQISGFREFFQAELLDGVGCLFLAQDYVEGQTYYDLLQSSNQLSEAEVTKLLYNLLPVLLYVHSQGVVHRDISPDNLILRSSDQLPVLIDFGGVKQVAATAISKFTQIGQVATRIGKKGYAPEEQMRQGQVFPCSDLYALAVTALVLLTGKEPQELYDSYKGTWLWQREIKISSQLEKVLQKMLAYKPGDRYQSAAEVIQALQSPNTTPAPPPDISQMRTVNFVGGKLNSSSNHSQPKSGTQVIAPATPTQHWLRPWVIKVAGSSLVVLAGISAWSVLSSTVMRLIPSVSLPGKPSKPVLAENTRNQQIHQRRRALGINEGDFNKMVNELFYTKYPQVQGRSLTLQAKDDTLRQDWYDMAENLLDKMERDNN